MKKILITGVNSYIGNSFETYLEKFEGYEIDKISVRNDDWKSVDFDQYDTVLHVAGIAHSDNGKISDEKAKLYYEVNTELTCKIAKKCCVNTQFIYMSSAIIFGESAPIGKSKTITKDTVPTPANAYGDSKLQAELKLQEMTELKLAIVRPPMVYGKGSKGNYPLLSKIARKLPVFPNIDNQRSMIYIENLCELIRLLIENEETGVYMPQNKEYVSTTKLVQEIGRVHKKKLITTRVFNVPLRLLANMTGLVNKAFGSLVYDMSLSEYKVNYRVVNFEESVKRTEV